MAGKSPIRGEHLCGAENGAGKDACEFAQAVAEARKYNVPWKLLQKLTGYSRTRLFQLKKNATSP